MCVFIKISDPNVLKKLIKTRGRNQIRHMAVQTMAAEKLCQCEPVSFKNIESTVCHY